MAFLHRTFWHAATLLLAICASSTAWAAEYTVQIGAFAERPNPAFAERAAQYGELLVLRGADGITRVSIGRFSNRSAAREALAELQNQGYPDAYVASVRGRGVATAPAQPTAPVAPAQSQPAREPATTQSARVVPPARVSPSAQSRGTTASGRQIITPKDPAASSQAGRFRLRTHDTQSGETRDLEVTEGEVIRPDDRRAAIARARARENQAAASDAVVAGMGVNEVPPHLRNKLVYLDGVPHIKDGDRFIPLTDVDSER